MPGQKLKKEYTHDFMSLRRLLLASIGYSESRSFLYITYIVLMLVYHVYLQLMAYYACYLVKSRRDLVIDAVHASLVSVFSVYGLCARIVLNSKMEQARDTARNGIYLYEDEELDENQEEMMKVVLPEIYSRTKINVIVFSLATISNMVFFPLSQLVMLTGDEKDEFEDILNPYFPQFFYSPFSFWTWWGFAINYLFNGLNFLYAYGSSICMNDIFIGCSVQLKAHLQVLNYSIKNIEKRAYDRYQRYNNNNLQLSQEDLIEDKDYQKCLYQCLKANIKHHLALLKFKSEFMPFTGACLFIVNVLATIIYAAILYLIYQKLPPNYIINFIVTLMCEQTYTFTICLYGQETTDQSSILYDSLYSIRWMDFDKSFNKALDIFMCNTLKPMTLKAIIISSSASLETYGDLISVVYKIMNLVKHSDDIKTH